MAQVGTTGSINRLKEILIAEVLTNTSSSYTLGTALSLGFESEMTWKPVFKTDDLETSQGIQTSDRYQTHVEWGIKFGKLNLDALALFTGNTVKQDTTVSATKSLLAYLKNSPSKKFCLAGRPVTVQGGPADFYTAILVCQAENIGGGQMGNAWTIQDVSGRGFVAEKYSAFSMDAYCEATTALATATILADIVKATT